MKNIFSPTFGNKPKSIVGRDKEIADFMEGLKEEPGHPNRATFFIGQRGMGKTALLLELAELSGKEKFVTVRTVAGEHMLNDIIEGIQIAGARTSESKKNPVKSVSAGAFGFSVGLTFSEEIQKSYGFRTKLMLLCEALAKRKRGVLFLIDEVHTSTPEMREFATAYQHLVGEGMNVAVAMAGLPNAISAILNDRILTFLNRAHKVELGLLPIVDVSACYLSAFANSGIEFDVKTLDLAAQATDGYPYLLQLVGYNMIKFLEGTNKLTTKIVDLSIIHSKQALVSDVFAPCLNPLSAEDKRFLKAMAQGSEESLVSELRVSLGVSKNHVQSYRQRLIDAGVVHAPSRGVLSFSVPYLRQYLRGEI